MTANLIDPTVQLLRAVFDACEVGVIILDGDRRIVLWNGWIAKTSAIPSDVALGAMLDEVFPQLAGTRVHQAVQNAVQHGLAALLSQTLHKAPFPLYRTPAERKEGACMQQAVIIKPIAISGTSLSGANCGCHECRGPRGIAAQTGASHAGPRRRVSSE